MENKFRRDGNASPETRAIMPVMSTTAAPAPDGTAANTASAAANPAAPAHAKTMPLDPLESA
jgi:hypothetical protein